MIAAAKDNSMMLQWELSQSAQDLHELVRKFKLSSLYENMVAQTFERPLFITQKFDSL